MPFLRTLLALSFTVFYCKGMEPPKEDKASNCQIGGNQPNLTVAEAKDLMQKIINLDEKRSPFLIAGLCRKLYKSDLLIPYEENILYKYMISLKWINLHFTETLDKREKVCELYEELLDFLPRFLPQHNKSVQGLKESTQFLFDSCVKDFGSALHIYLEQLWDQKNYQEAVRFLESHQSRYGQQYLKRITQTAYLISPIYTRYTQTLMEEGKNQEAIASCRKALKFCIDRSQLPLISLNFLYSYEKLIEEELNQSQPDLEKITGYYRKALKAGKHGYKVRPSDRDLSQFLLETYEFFIGFLFNTSQSLQQVGKIIDEYEHEAKTAVTIHPYLKGHIVNACLFRAAMLVVNNAPNQAIRLIKKSRAMLTEKEVTTIINIVSLYDHAAQAYYRLGNYAKARQACLDAFAMITLLKDEVEAEALKVKLAFTLHDLKEFKELSAILEDIIKTATFKDKPELISYFKQWLFSTYVNLALQGEGAQRYECLLQMLIATEEQDASTSFLISYLRARVAFEEDDEVKAASHIEAIKSSTVQTVEDEIDLSPSEEEPTSSMVGRAEEDSEKLTPPLKNHDQFNIKAYFSKKWTKLGVNVFAPTAKDQEKGKEEADDIEAPVEIKRTAHFKTFEDLWSKKCQIPLRKIEAMLAALGVEISGSLDGSKREYIKGKFRITMDAVHHGPTQQGRQQLFRNFLEQAHLSPGNVILRGQGKERTEKARGKG
ncbi:hypothetical protein [Candidatus Odyssella thessalonicensis]|uniref:hypothetical protein n=1 Tax=Candidatus Odyssella thessalonicensis TaxID=84647 RepID=UPI000225BF85|nr:hypothetical protein [Candidatus Odyssella thessalonicensis]